jgi:ectoine hydroxylase-related dioxygenase (phytanoyl-CoA dioxygenase family)
VPDTIEVYTADLAMCGYVVIPDVIPAGQVKVLRQLTEDLYVTDPGVLAKQSVPGKELLAHLELLPDKGPDFESFFLHPEVHQVVARFLGPDFIANDVYSMGLLPGYPGRPFHVDEPLPHSAHSLAINVLYPLTDFTEPNGATRFLPGSHLWPAEHRARIEAWLCGRQGPVAGEVAVPAPAGSALMLLGGVYHSPGANRTPSVRPTLASLFTVPWMKPYTDFTRALKPEVLSRATPVALRLYGFGSVVPPAERWDWPEAQAGRALQWRRPDMPAAGVGEFEVKRFLERR